MARSTVNEEELEKQKRRIEAREENVKADMRLIIQRPEGQRVLAYLLEMFNPLAESFDTNGSIMSRNEGRREAGREIYRLIQSVNYDKAIEIMHSLEKKEKEDV